MHDDVQSAFRGRVPPHENVIRQEQTRGAFVCLVLDARSSKESLEFRDRFFYDLGSLGTLISVGFLGHPWQARLLRMPRNSKALQTILNAKPRTRSLEDPAREWSFFTPRAIVSRICPGLSHAPAPCRPACRDASPVLHGISSVVALSPCFGERLLQQLGPHHLGFFEGLGPSR